MITNENWLDFCATFFGYDRKWLKHVTDNWNTVINKTGCGCESYIKCRQWLDLNPVEFSDDAKDAEIYTNLEYPAYDVTQLEFGYLSLPPEIQEEIMNDIRERQDDDIVDVELPKAIES